MRTFAAAMSAILAFGLLRGARKAYFPAAFEDGTSAHDIAGAIILGGTFGTWGIVYWFVPRPLWRRRRRRRR